MNTTIIHVRSRKGQPPASVRFTEYTTKGVPKGAPPQGEAPDKNKGAAGKKESKKTAVVTKKSNPNQQPAKVPISSKQQPDKKRLALVVHPPYNGTLQRAFAPYPHELPCLPGPFGQYDYGTMDVTINGRDTLGMFYAKLSKCSSSTLAGIAVQIARNTARRRRKKGVPLNLSPSECMVKANHGRYKNLMKRDKKNSMLWTFIREPASREVSDFFHFHVSRKGVNPHDDAQFQHEASQALSMVNTLAGKGYDGQGWGKEKISTAEQKVAYVMNAYDFIGLVERHDESLILLKLIYKLQLKDILYVSAKQSGGYDDGEFKDKCIFIQPSVVSPAMRRWFQNSTTWHKRSEADALLYRVVSKSIDLTIDSMGRGVVEHQVQQLRQALQLAQETCGPTAVYPCSANGTKRGPQETTCIQHDWACAHKCIFSLDLSGIEGLAAH